MTITARGEAYDVVNPSTLEVVDQVRESTLADVDTAISKAASVQPEWSATDHDARAAVIAAGARRILDHADELAALLTCEQGKPLAESRIEVLRSAGTLSFYAELPRPEKSPVRDLADHLTGSVVRLPLGVCAAIVPWNFPLGLLANKLAPGLVTGNTLVTKPSPSTPLASKRFIELLFEAGLPEGVVEFVLGGRDVGMHLITHPLVRMISFTGSTRVGKEVMATAAEGLKRLTLELGGNDALIVHHDADLDAVVDAAVSSRFFNAGQGCIATKRIYAHTSIHDAFTRQLSERVADLRVGDGFTEDVKVGPLHSAQQRDSVERLAKDAIERGARVAVGGGRPDGAGPGYFFEPTVIVGTSDDAELMREECFGPVLPIFTYESISEAIDKANSTRYGLGSSVWTSDPAVIEASIDMLQAGYTWVNTPAFIYDAMPHGGVKESGFGKEKGFEALDEFTVLKSVIRSTAS